MIEAVSLPIEINLKSFSEQLHRLGLQHRIVEESGRQVIWVNSDSEAKLLKEALEQWLALGNHEQSADASSAGSPISFDKARNWPNLIWHGIYSSPFTWLAMIICAFVAVISRLGSNTSAVRELFYPLLPSSDLLSLLAAVDSPMVFLNTLGPMFLHFGELHLVFNMLWLWYFGRQLESLQSRWWFLGLVVSTAFVSNTAQYLVLGYNNFGGMSGVVYGLVGYSWAIHYFMPRSNLLINNSMFVFFVIALVAMEIFASSWIATAAHAAGLGTGLVLGVATVVIYRFILKRQVIGYNRSS